MKRFDRLVGVVFPWICLATAVYFGWTAVVYLNRLEVGWATFGLVMVAVNVRHFITIRRNHRTLVDLDADIAATRRRIEELGCGE